ncbi:hypothetical protein BH20ACT3_BH20ACT3_03950 [soil metagenome]
MAKGNDTSSEKASKEERAAGVERTLTDQEPPVNPPPNEPGGSHEVGGASEVGESITRSGEDVEAKEGKEAGRSDTGETPEGRPTGTSSDRDITGVGE